MAKKKAPGRVVTARSFQLAVLLGFLIHAAVAVIAFA